MYRHAVTLLGQAQLLLDDMTAVQATRRRHRLIVAGPGYVSFRLTRVFADFTTKYPEWQVVHEPHDHASARQAAQLVASGRADIAFALSASGMTPAGGEALWQEGLGLYVGRGHPLAARERVPAAELSRFPLIHLPQSDPLRSVIDAALNAASITGSPIALHTANAMLARRTLMQSSTLGCLFSHLVRRDVEQGLLVELQLERALPFLEVGVFTSARALVQRTAASLITLVRDEIAKDNSLLSPQ